MPTSTTLHLVVAALTGGALISGAGSPASAQQLRWEIGPSMGMRLADQDATGLGGFGSVGWPLGARWRVMAFAQFSGEKPEKMVPPGYSKEPDPSGGFFYLQNANGVRVHPDSLVAGTWEAHHSGYVGIERDFPSLGNKTIRLGAGYGTSPADGTIEFSTLIGASITGRSWIIVEKPFSEGFRIRLGVWLIGRR